MLRCNTWSAWLETHARLCETGVACGLSCAYRLQVGADKAGSLNGTARRQRSARDAGATTLDTGLTSLLLAVVAAWTEPTRDRGPDMLQRQSRVWTTTSPQLEPHLHPWQQKRRARQTARGVRHILVAMMSAQLQYWAHPALPMSETHVVESTQWSDVGVGGDGGGTNGGDGGGVASWLCAYNRSKPSWSPREDTSDWQFS